MKTAQHVCQYARAMATTGDGVEQDFHHTCQTFIISHVRNMSLKAKGMCEKEPNHLQKKAKKDRREIEHKRVEWQKRECFTKLGENNFKFQ